MRGLDGTGRRRGEEEREGGLYLSWDLDQEERVRQGPRLWTDFQRDGRGRHGPPSRVCPIGLTSSLELKGKTHPRPNGETHMQSTTLTHPFILRPVFPDGGD